MVYDVYSIVIGKLLGARRWASFQSSIFNLEIDNLAAPYV
jgi:hypothetical protein